MKRDGAEVFGAELSTDGKFITIGEPGWRQIIIDPKTQTLFQKEAALNLVLKTLNPRYDAVAWLDCDIWFSNPEWLADTVKLLNTSVEVVQLFAGCHWTSEVGQSERTGVGFVKSTDLFNIIAPGHPGFAWAARREVLDQAEGLFSIVPTGGADRFAAMAFRGMTPPPELAIRLGINHRPFEEWAARVRNVRLGYVAGEVFHEWHGDLRNRSYNQDLSFLKNLDVEKHLEFDKHGLLRWTTEAPDEIVRAVSQQFFDRKEDG